jgi:hypothetical protein
MTYLNISHHPLHVVGMELNLNRLPDYTAHISGFDGEDTSVSELYAVSQIVFCPATADLSG